MNYAVFDSLLESVFVLDAQGQFLYGNAAASLLFDVSQKRLQSGKPVNDLIQFADPSFHSADFLAALTGPSPYIEISFTSKSGREGLVQVSVQPVEGVDKHFIIYIRDVTLEQTLQRKYRAELEQKEGYIAELEKARAELENYSKNLEKMVQERTRELNEANALLKAILDSLGEGFFVFNAEGLCLPVFSKVCADIVECEPAGKKIEDVLKIPVHEAETFDLWKKTLFAEPIPFEDIVALGPALYSHSQGRRIELGFEPMRSEGGAIEGVVVVAADKTAEYQARLEAQKERAHVQLILKIVKNKKQFMAFLEDANKLIAKIDEELKKPSLDASHLGHHLHTLKGGAGTFSIKEVHDHAHHVEDLLGAWGRETDLSAKQKVLQEVITGCQQLGHDLQHFMQEHSALLAGPAGGRKKVEVDMEQLLHWSQNQATSTLTKEIIDAAREPIGQSFSHYSDLVQEIAEAQSKKLLPMEMTGGDLKVFADHYNDVFASFIHIFRNAIDHGLETPEERESAGKPAAGKMVVEFKKANKQITIRLQDDGRGISPQIIRKKLSEKGYPQTVQQETDEQIIQHVFDDNFSTRDTVTALSGRGVGLGAVRAAVEALGGKVLVRSQVGRGSEFVIEIPDFDRPPVSLKSAA